MKVKTWTALATLLVLSATARAANDPIGENPDFEKCVFTGASWKKIPYRLLKPEGYDPAANTSYPLVIFLHGLGERGDDNNTQLLHGVREFDKPEARKKHPCFVIAPQCPKTDLWAPIKRDGTKITIIPSKEPTESTALVLELIDALPREFHIDTKRIYLTGLSMGGFGTWDILGRHADRFAAAIPVCGGGLEENAPAMVSIPLWVFHGANDPLVKPEFSRSMVAAIRKAGGKPGYTEFPNVLHDSWVKTYHDPDVLDWLFAQKKK